MFTSFIISTYNRHDALICVLESLNEQSELSFEVIIADDGSSNETRDAIEAFREKSKFVLKHVWQKDQGFRAAQIRNKAVAKASGEYLIFLDGDCLVFPDFVEKHIALAETGYFIRGSRIMLSKEYTKYFIENDISMSDMSLLSLLYLRLSKKIKRFLPLIHVPLGKLREMKTSSWYGVKTCNLGMWRSDFMAVNGFDERYVGWGHEDADLAVRLINNGVRRKEGVYAVTVLHLWHPWNDRSKLAENVARLKFVQQSKNIWAKQGVSQY